MTKTESVLLALKALLDGTPGLPPLSRNANTYTRVAAFTAEIAGEPVTVDVGFVLFDGTGRIDDERAALGDYELEHTAELEILVQGEACDAVFDAILDALGALAEANRTSDHWDFLELGVPNRDFAGDETHDQGKGCVLPVILTFRSTQPF